MEKLSPDTISEIRCRLPIKSIFDCRKVCRIWRSLFRKPKNTGMLFACRPKDGHDYFEVYCREVPSQKMVSFNRIEEPQNIYKLVTKIFGTDRGKGFVSFSFVGISNGLICYNTYEVKYMHDRTSQHDEFIYIFNPITDERIRIPVPIPIPLPAKRKYHAFGGEIDPAGFGYCHSTNAYKVVKIIGISKQRVQVYTLGDGKGWRDKPQTTYSLRKSGVYANGALHWLNKKSKRTVTKFNCEIVAFDVADETFQTIPSPPSHSPPFINMSWNSSLPTTLGSYGGNLYLCLPYDNQVEPTMEIWVFKKKNLKNCSRSTLLDESMCYSNSFIWIKVFTGKVDKELNSNCQMLDLTESEILLWQDGVLYCFSRTTSEKLWTAKCATGHAQPTSLVSMNDLGEGLVSMNDLGEDLDV